MANSLTAAIKATVNELEMIKQDLIISYQVTLYEIGKLLVFHTPIDTGRASSNWNISSGERTEAERDPSGSDVKGELSIEAMSYQVKNLHEHPEALFYNPVDYIDILDGGYKGGGVGSPQAPAGMTRPTSTQIDKIWIKNLKENGLIK